ncbi:hypothetical protein BHK98_07440 [Hornefia porci]|uniref:Calcineurin-like phosphoesterase domain-containing protein n=1 Tax=Hornefia porci TaxID=2652292 RepID=A0A1Q9JI71_9FIRM|nr:metallophosphoesterase family protein [Hornefia porci]OLR55906.1 hypothetical protein BHK98_07440 [Hornefia porci]
MKILAISDIEEEYLWGNFAAEKLEGVELILSCGDLAPEYLEFLVTMTNVPLLYVHGNHDQKYDFRPPQGCVCIDGSTASVLGLRIAGLGGSMRYKEGSHMYTEEDMCRRARRLDRQIRRQGGLDVFLTHAPAAGWGDLEDRAHLGFRCFNDILERWQPDLMFHGHVHGSYVRELPTETEHDCGTRIINAFGRAETIWPREEGEKMEAKERK